MMNIPFKMAQKDGAIKESANWSAYTVDLDAVMSVKGISLMVI